jgi:hypothetical protein
MKTATCHNAPCDHITVERPRYFARQLLTPDDLSLEAQYFLDKARRHNRLVHGWGVVCGALVCPVSNDGGKTFEPWKVKVTSGYILGPYGDEILVDCDHTVDLRTTGMSSATGQPCVDTIVDPWCSEVFVQRKKTGPLYIAVKYKQIMTRPVRVQPAGCGCDDSQCEFSRWSDGYEIGILTSWSGCQDTPPSLDGLFKGDEPACPACPDQPWVVLAVVQIDDNGAIKSIDNCSCRRIVLSFGNLWWRCAAAALSDVAVQGAPDRVVQAGSDIAVQFTGVNLRAGATVNLGAGITIKEVKWADSAHINVTAHVEDTAVAGFRTATIIQPDGSTATFANAIEVRAKPAPAPSPGPAPGPAPAPSQPPGPGPAPSSGPGPSPAPGPAPAGGGTATPAGGASPAANQPSGAADTSGPPKDQPKKSRKDSGD